MQLAPGSVFLETGGEGGMKHTETTTCKLGKVLKRRKVKTTIKLGF